jgi:hypothetical protein
MWCRRWKREAEDLRERIELARLSVETLRDLTNDDYLDAKLVDILDDLDGETDRL